MSIFQQVPKARVQKASFDLSHSRKLSMNLGQLVPILVQEVVPGDRFNISTESMVRMAPMIAPVMHRMHTYIHYFFVPNRILWQDWEDFITGTSEITVPTCPMGNVPVGSLGDHMGLPVGDWNGTEEINALPIRAYWKIWNDYYRDQNLESEVNIDDLVDEEGAWTNKPAFSAWEKDYFTSALKSPQAGTKVSMKANVEYNKALLKYENGNVPAEGVISLDQQADASGVKGRMVVPGNATGMVIENISSVTVDVEELRMATRLQRWLERNARSGNRYVEHLLAHWGIRSSDARLQRAEYLGGGKTPVIISDVANMTGTATAPQGTLSGNGLSVGQSNRASKFVEEHGFIIGIMKVLPETAYFQGVPRFLSRKLNLDYYFPEFAQLGEQPIPYKEIVFQEGDGNDLTFGYQSRFAEMKYGMSTVHGKFKTDLEFWHMARKFSGTPSLNSDFIKADKISDTVGDPWRIFAVSEAGSEQLYVQLYHHISATRPMPFLNDPTL